MDPQGFFHLIKSEWERMLFHSYQTSILHVLSIDCKSYILYITVHGNNATKQLMHTDIQILPIRKQGLKVYFKKFQFKLY